jgi:hypothetical protein
MNVDIGDIWPTKELPIAHSNFSPQTHQHQLLPQILDPI